MAALNDHRQPRAGEGGAHGSGLVLASGLGIAGAALLCFAAMMIHGFVDAVARRAPIIVWDSGGWAALPIGIALLALAIALYIGRGQGPDVEGPRRAVIKRLLVLSACLLPFVIVLPVGAQWVAARQLEARGYSDCGAGMWVAVGRAPSGASARCDAP